MHLFVLTGDGNLEQVDNFQLVEQSADVDTLLSCLRERLVFSFGGAIAYSGLLLASPETGPSASLKMYDPTERLVFLQLR